jgi:hypothetical protein
MTTIELVISPTGEVRLQTRGYAGNGCLAASRELEAALGLPTSARLTSEFYQTTQHDQASLAERQRPT